MDVIPAKAGIQCLSSYDTGSPPPTKALEGRLFAGTTKLIFKASFIWAKFNKSG